MPACFRSASMCEEAHSAASAEPLLIAIPSSMGAQPSLKVQSVKMIAETCS